jgi:hypothetical protein
MTVKGPTKADPLKKPAKRAPARRRARKKPIKKEPAKMGRPTKLTEEIKSTLIAVIRIGVPLKTALGYVGLTDDVIYYWRNQAEAAKKLVRPTKDQKAAIDFFGEVDMALHEASVEAQRTVYEIATTPLERTFERVDEKTGEVITYTLPTPTEEKRLALQAATFHLTHRNSKDYSTRVTTEVTGEDGGPVNISGKMAIQLLRELVADDE